MRVLNILRSTYPLSLGRGGQGGEAPKPWAKPLLLLLLLLTSHLSLLTSAQSLIQENRGSQMAVGRWIITKGLRLPVADTICNLANYNADSCTGSMVYRPQDGKVYIKKTDKWHAVGSDVNLSPYWDSVAVKAYALAKADSTAGGYYPYSTNPHAYWDSIRAKSWANATFQPAGSYLTAPDIAGKLNISDTTAMLNGRIGSITINPSGSIHNTPVTFTNTGGAWAGTLSLANQSAFTVLRRGTGTGTPSFGSIDSSYFGGQFQTQARAAVGTVNNSRILFSASGEVKDTATLSYDRATGNVGIGIATPAASAILDLSTSTKGLLIPRMTETQRNTISSPPNGLILYNADGSSLEVFDSLFWSKLAVIGDYPFVIPVAGESFFRRFGNAASYTNSVTRASYIGVSLLRKCTIASASVWATATSSGVIKIGLYRSNSSYKPGILIDSAIINITSATAVTGNFVQTPVLTPGIYFFLALPVSGTFSLYGFTGATGLSSNNFPFSNSIRGGVGDNLARDGGYGFSTLPSSLKAAETGYSIQYGSGTPNMQFTIGRVF